MKANKYIQAFQASRIPVILFAVDILLMTIEPKYWVPDRATVLGLELGTWRNIVVLLFGLPYIFQKGWRKPFNPVAIGYTLVLLTTILLSTPLPQLTHVQSLKSYASLLLGPLVFYEIRYDQRDLDFLLELLSLVAIVNVVVGILLFVAGVHPFIVREVSTSALRLAGAGISAPLSLAALVAMIASLLLYRKSWKYLILTAINLIIIILTGTRGTGAAAVVVLAGFILNEQRGRGWKAVQPIIIAAAAGLICGLAVYAPMYALRFHLTASEERYLLGTSLEGDDMAYMINTSGRLKTWSFFWGLAKENPLFGRGIGAGTLGDQMSTRLLRVPHNEYLRFLVEGGFIGTFIMLGAYGLQFGSLHQIARKDYQIFFLLLVLMYAALATVENVISGPAVAALFWTLLGIIRERLLAENHPPAEA